MIRGVGCDVADVERIRPLAAQERFLQKVYTPRERAAIAAKGAPTAAGLWAAKEAVSKALGTGFDGFGPREVEICTTGRGAPEVQLHSGAQARLTALGGERIHVSISHERTLALAFAVVE